MKKDPNKYCINFKQNLIWAIIHDVIAHPLMGVTLYSKYSIMLHDYTSGKAWKRPIFSPMLIPDSPGQWKHISTGQVLDVYALESVDNTLCIWCNDVGIEYTDLPYGGTRTIWATGAWVGHIPVSKYVTINYHMDTVGWTKI